MRAGRDLGLGLLALVLLAGGSLGCDKLGLGAGGEDSEAKKDDDGKSKKDDDGDDKSKKDGDDKSAKSKKDGDDKSAKSDGKSGVPECDEYFATIERCVKNMPEQAKGPFAQAAKAMKDGLDKAGTAEAKKAYAAGCKQANDAVKNNPACSAAGTGAPPVAGAATPPAAGATPGAANLGPGCLEFVRVMDCMKGKVPAAQQASIEQSKQQVLDLVKTLGPGGDQACLTGLQPQKAVIAQVGCDKPGDAPPPPVAGAVPPPAAATGAAPAAGGASLATLFTGDVPAGGTARPIFAGGKGTGVIMLVPKEFAAGSGVYGDGYQTSSPNSALNFQVEKVPGITDRITKLTNTQLKMLCYPNKIDKITWEAPADVKFGPDATAAIAWKGQGKHIGNKKPWGAYAISTVIQKNKRVTGCGGWNLANPEAENGVVVALKSLRIGVAANTDPGFP